VSPGDSTQVAFGHVLLWSGKRGKAEGHRSTRHHAERMRARA
jgi:hypothetical protein